MPSGFKIYIFPRCIYRIPTRHNLQVAMKHCIKQADLGRRNLKHRRNMDKQITSMITVAGEYCAFFFFSRRNCPNLNLIRRQRKKEFPLSLSVWCFLCPREQVSVNKGRKKKPLTLQMISQSDWNCTRTKEGGRNLFLNPTWPRFDSIFPIFREPLKRPRLHRVQNLVLKLPHKSAQLELCFWLQWRKKLIGCTDKEENSRVASLRFSLLSFRCCYWKNVCMPQKLSQMHDCETYAC